MRNKISIFGLWHLGSVISTCCAKHFNVVAYDSSKDVILNLNNGCSPIYEPSLNERIKEEIASTNLKFTDDIQTACNHSDIFWITYDTPVDDNDRGDMTFIYDRITEICKIKESPSLILISTQIIATTCAKLEKQFPHHKFVYIPENLRLGKGIETFEKAERFIVGCRDIDIETVKQLLSSFQIELVFMKSESAEMVKHSINSFLALSVTFINEIATICEQIGADAKEVSLGIKSDNRIGKKSYLNPGEPFAGGTLARDIVSLGNLNKIYNINSTILSSIIESNENHKKWYLNKLKSLNYNSVLFLGLAYTENTNTLRRSNALNLYKQINSQNIKFYAYDSLIKTLPEEYSQIELLNNLDDLIVDVIIVLSQQSSFKLLNFNKLKNEKTYVIDINKYLYDQVKNNQNIKYISLI